MVKILASLIFICSSLFLIGQEQVTIDGYAFESGNRGFIQGVLITLKDMDGNRLGATFSDADGHFVIKTERKEKYHLLATKERYNDREISVNGERVDDKDQVFLKLEMLRSPGYDFEITLAEARDEEGTPVDGISGARIDVYNNTTEEEVFVLEDYMEPEFDVHLKKGNHYTMLIRKDGYIAKRIEAFVNVNECILCVEGLGNINSGVSDNLSMGNQMGVLLANVELEKIRIGKKLEVQNIYYDFGSARLTKDARENLNTLVTMMADTPELLVELGSHTDSRGGDAANMKLSEARANSAVQYIRNGGIAAYRIEARGYGENILKNNCGDGSNCNEAEHAENRRTELKIVGMTDRKSRMKSLAEIKRAEKAEEELLVFQFGGQVQIPDGMSIKDLSDEEVDQLLNNAKAEKEFDVEDENDENAMEEINAMTEHLELEESVNAISEQIEIDQIDEITEEVREKVEVESDVKSEVVKEKIVEEIPAGASESVEDDMNSVMKDKVKEVKSGTGPATQVEDSSEYGNTVYKIVIHQSDKALSEDAPLLNKHSDIIEYIDRDNTFKYLIGSFDSESQATQFLKGSVKSAYPDAFLVKYKGGEIISQ